MRRKGNKNELQTEYKMLWKIYLKKSIFFIILFINQHGDLSPLPWSKATQRSDAVKDFVNQSFSGHPFTPAERPPPLSEGPKL
ncbi:MAG: hypothetical protein KAJ07_09070 [Planctomycetes bacterium]|nr:hypothetical protein [Planctomycetota bacterium]